MVDFEPFGVYNLSCFEQSPPFYRTLFEGNVEGNTTQFYSSLLHFRRMTEIEKCRKHGKKQTMSIVLK